MTRPLLTLVPCLAVVAALQGAEGDGFRAGNNAGEVSPGKPYAIGQGRQVLVQGMLDLDVINRGQYLSGNRSVSDHAGYGYGRAELGIKLKPDEQSSVTVSVAYQDESGDTPDGNGHYAVINQAFVDLRDVLGFESFGLLGGRMPVAWNLRPGHGGFLYDSRADHPQVTSWDGAQVSFTGIEHAQINPLIYAMPNSGTMFGAEANYEPALSGDQRLFLTGMATWEKKTPIRAVDTALSKDSRIVYKTIAKADTVATYDVGATITLASFEIYAEGAIQRGRIDSSVDLNANGGYIGCEWAPRSPRLVVGVQADHKSGESNPTVLAGQPYPWGFSGTSSAFLNPWEGVNDLYIVENEKYGEISGYLQGPKAFGLQALKLHTGYTFDDRGKFSLDGVYGYFRTAKTASGTLTNYAYGVPIGTFALSGRKFGQEFDLTFAYRYNFNTTLKLFGGAFLPGDAFRIAAPAPDTAKDFIYLMGANLLVKF